MHPFHTILAVTLLTVCAMSAQASDADFKTLYESLAERGEYDPQADAFKPMLHAAAESDRVAWPEGDWRQVARIFAVGKIPGGKADIGVWTFKIDRDANAVRTAPLATAPCRVCVRGSH